jgi:hypothetical protein
MNDITTFLVGASITVAASVAVILFIRRHLRKVLIDLTGTEARADFWIAFTSLLLILIPLIVAMFVPPDGRANVPVFFQVTAQLKWSLIALVATLVSYGFIIIWFVRTRQPPQPPLDDSPARPEPGPFTPSGSPPSPTP